MPSSKELRSHLLSLDMEIYEEEQGASQNEVEVVADSYEQALDIAKQYLNVKNENLDVQLLERGSTGFLGLFKVPFKYKFYNKNANDRIASEIVSLEGTNNKIQDQLEKEEEIEKPPVNGKVIIRIYKIGCFIKITPPERNGIPIDMYSVMEKIQKFGIHKFDESIVKQAVKEKKATYLKFGHFQPKEGAESRLDLNVTPDNLKAFLKFTKPFLGGRHLLPQEVLAALKGNGIIYGINIKKIEEALENDLYNQDILVAEGLFPQDGKDGEIVYKFRIEERKEFSKDKSGKIDYFAQNSIENVIQGQVLAELILPKKGIKGKTIFGEDLDVKDGKATMLKAGEGVLFSNDNLKLLAERDGQVVLRGGKVEVDKVYSVHGDVGLSTGNIMFLGTVVVSGGVEDNAKIKASGNIDIIGNVQKSYLEAEGDIIMRGGMQGRKEGLIKSTSGNIYAKFIQNATIKTAKHLYVGEGIMHSTVLAGKKVICSGKRAQIVGGKIIAAEEIRAKQLGAQASTPTHIIVGINPQHLEYRQKLEEEKNAIKMTFKEIEKNLKVLNSMRIRVIRIKEIMFYQ